MKLLFMLFISSACFGQAKKDTTKKVINDSIEVVVLRFTIAQYNLLMNKVDSLNDSHLKVREIRQNLQYYSIEKYKQPTQTAGNK